MDVQVPLGDRYGKMSNIELEQRIDQRKKQLGDALCILGHHYQRDAIVRFADFVGDSLKLSQLAARQTARYIVFCGVHFMAESADVLSGNDQVVVLPNMRAGCAMADMAEPPAVEAALEELEAMTDAVIVPVTYVNSAAAIKAATARHGGACCTSSNVRNVFEWALRPRDKGGAGADKIFAIPDEHLGRNTAVAMGYSVDECVVYHPDLPNGGISPEQLRKAKFILWRGCCYVHQLFRPEHVAAVRNRHPDIKVIVHPECPHEVVRLSDACGSTEQIIAAVRASEGGSQWAIGTESNLVNRLARELGDRFVRVLSDAPSMCAQMQRIDLAHLLWVLDNLAEDKVVNRVSVPGDIAGEARVALERMVAIKPARNVNAVS